MAELVTDEPEVRLTAVSRLTCGQFVIVPDGRVGIVQSKEPVEIGDEASVRIRGIIKAKAGATMGAGDTVDANLTLQTIIATGGAGTYAGKLLYDVTTGKDAYVDLNP